MALPGGYVKNLVKKAPAPDALAAMGADDDEGKGDEPEPKDEDGDEAAMASAFDDFAAALKAGKNDAARSALGEYIKLCK